MSKFTQEEQDWKRSGDVIVEERNGVLSEARYQVCVVARH